MNCKEFKELSDSYLSNELLIETNHSMIRHLESCHDCREDLARIREFRRRLVSAVLSDEETGIDPAFEIRLRAALRSEAFASEPFGVRMLRFAFASVLGAMLLGIAVFLLRENPTPTQLVLNPNNTNVTNSTVNDWTQGSIEFARIRNDAFEDHEDCALSHRLEERPISLADASVRYDPAYLDLEKIVHEALKGTHGSELKLLKAHYCLINKRGFAHIVLEMEGEVVSVLMTPGERRNNMGDRSPTECGNSGKLSAVCARADRFEVFVVSQMNQDKNKSVANAVFAPIRNHIASGGQSV